MAKLAFSVAPPSVAPFCHGGWHLLFNSETHTFLPLCDPWASPAPNVSRNAKQCWFEDHKALKSWALAPFPFAYHFPPRLPSQVLPLVLLIERSTHCATSMGSTHCFGDTNILGNLQQTAFLSFSFQPLPASTSCLSTGSRAMNGCLLQLPHWPKSCLPVCIHPWAPRLWGVTVLDMHTNQHRSRSKGQFMTQASSRRAPKSNWLTQESPPSCTTGH
jgi:hypothetical protein